MTHQVSWATLDTHVGHCIRSLFRSVPGGAVQVVPHMVPHRRHGTLTRRSAGAGSAVVSLKRHHLTRSFPFSCFQKKKVLPTALRTEIEFSLRSFFLRVCLEQFVRFRVSSSIGEDFVVFEVHPPRWFPSTCAYLLCFTFFHAEFFFGHLSSGSHGTRRSTLSPSHLLVPRPFASSPPPLFSQAVLPPLEAPFRNKRICKTRDEVQWR